MTYPPKEVKGAKSKKDKKKKPSKSKNKILKDDCEIINEENNETKIHSDKNLIINPDEINVKTENKDKFREMESLEIEETNIIIQNILADLELDKKLDHLDYNNEEIEDNTNKNKKKKLLKKYVSIDVDENLEYNLKEPEINNTSNLDVQKKAFDKPNDIQNNIIYNGKKFYLDSHQNNKYPTEINYRCKNYRKHQRIRKKQFCNAIVKRKEEKKCIYYILDKGHSKERKELATETPSARSLKQ